MASRLFHFLVSKSSSLLPECCCPCQFRSFKATLSKDLFVLQRRSFSSNFPPPMDEAKRKIRIKSTLYYLSALGVLTVGGSYAAVPLYRIFCASYSYGGTTSTHAGDKDLSLLQKFKDKEITIRFYADKSSSMQWNFRPEQSEIIVTPGETALAFYRAENRTSKPVDGISTYNVIPFEAGQYFNKIQCFCFEEQRLNPGETVELPVFFYIDPEFVNDPKMQNVNLISLSYTFFESKEMPDFKFSNWSPHGNKVSAKEKEMEKQKEVKISSPVILNSSPDSSNIAVSVV